MDASYVQPTAEAALWAAVIALIVGAITYAVAMQAADFDPRMEILAHDQEEFWRMRRGVHHRVEEALWGSYVWGAVVYAVTLYLLAPELVRLLHPGFIWAWVGVGWFGALLVHEAHRASWDRRLKVENFTWIQPGQR